MVIGAVLIASIVGYEGFREAAYIPIPGDVPTIGYGHTTGVQDDDFITQERAIQLLNEDLDNIYAKGVKECITAPIFDYEFRSYVSLTYNIGVDNFCGSTLVKKLNAEDYHGACTEILRWNKAGGEVIQGLVNRRQSEYATCIGEKEVFGEEIIPIDQISAS